MPTAPAHFLDLAEINGPVRRNLEILSNRILSNYQVVSSTTRPTASSRPPLAVGMVIYETDTYEFLIWNGVSWRKPWKEPWGIIGYATVTADPTTFSAITDLTGASITFTAVANRRYKITGSVLFVIAAASTQPALYIRDGAGTQIQGVVSEYVAAGNVSNCFAQVVVSPAAGSVTYKLSGIRNGGTGTMTTLINASRPDFILIEDIGPNGVPT